MRGGAFLRGLRLPHGRPRNAHHICRPDLNAQFKTLFTIPINGVPSRCRVSPNGRTGAFTFFVSGHSYASLDFSTQTLLVDTRDGRTLAKPEELCNRKEQPAV